MEWKSTDSSSISVSRVSKVVNTVENEQVTDNACSNPSKSAKSAVNQLLGVSQVTEVLGTAEIKSLTDNAGKSTSDNEKKVGDASADKYALELQTAMKKKKN